MPSMVREEENNHVCTERVKFSFDIVPKRYNLSKILQISGFFNSEIPFVEIYLKIVIIEESNDYYTRMFIYYTRIYICSI